MVWVRFHVHQQNLERFPQLQQNDDRNAPCYIPCPLPSSMLRCLSGTFFKCGAVTWTILAMHCSSISQQQVSHNHSTSTSLSLHLCPLALHKPLLPMTLQVRSRDWLCKTTSQRLVTAAPTILNNVAAVFIYTGRWRILSAKCCAPCNLSSPIDKLLDINGVCFSCHLLQHSPRFPWNSNELRALVPLKTVLAQGML